MHWPRIVLAGFATVLACRVAAASPVVSAVMGGALPREEMGQALETYLRQVRRDLSARPQRRALPVRRRASLGKAAGFLLSTPEGGRLSLENTLKGKKAVLVTFWFYH